MALWLWYSDDELLKTRPPNARPYPYCMPWSDAAKAHRKKSVTFYFIIYDFSLCVSMCPQKARDKRRHESAPLSGELWFEYSFIPSIWFPHNRCAVSEDAGSGGKRNKVWRLVFGQQMRFMFMASRRCLRCRWCINTGERCAWAEPRQLEAFAAQLEQRALSHTHTCAHVNVHRRREFNRFPESKSCSRLVFMWDTANIVHIFYIDVRDSHIAMAALHYSISNEPAARSSHFHFPGFCSPLTLDFYPLKMLLLALSLIMFRAQEALNQSSLFLN